jgi:hypothetical protein
MGRYKTFASPFAKVFLGAVFTYQVIYWTWVKLEMEEVKVGRNRMSSFNPLFSLPFFLAFCGC